MSKSIMLTQYAEDGSVVHVIVNTGEKQQAVDDAGDAVFEQTGTETKQRPTGQMKVLETSPEGTASVVEPEMEDYEAPIMVPVMVPVTDTITFGAMPEFAWGHVPIPNTAPQEFSKAGPKFKVEDYVAQCEREVQSLIDAETAAPKLIEVPRG